MYEKANAISLFKHVTDEILVKIFDSFCNGTVGKASLDYSNNQMFFWESKKVNRKSQLKLERLARNFFARIDADTLWRKRNKFFAPKCACACLLASGLNPRGPFISLHCNYVWWQNYDPFEARTAFEATSRDWDVIGLKQSERL